MRQSGRVIRIMKGVKSRGPNNGYIDDGFSGLRYSFSCVLFMPIIHEAEDKNGCRVFAKTALRKGTHKMNNEKIYRWKIFEFNPRRGMKCLVDVFDSSKDHAQGLVDALNGSEASPRGWRRFIPFRNVRRYSMEPLCVMGWMLRYRDGRIMAFKSADELIAGRRAAMERGEEYVDLDILAERWMREHGHIADASKMVEHVSNTYKLG